MNLRPRVLAEKWRFLVAPAHFSAALRAYDECKQQTSEAIMYGALATRQHSLPHAIESAESPAPRQTRRTLLGVTIAALALLAGAGAVELARTVIWPMLVTAIAILTNPSGFPSL